MQPVSGVDIAGEIVEYVVSAAKVGIGGSGQGRNGYLKRIARLLLLYLKRSNY